MIKLNSRNTKNEILEAYNDLVKEVKDAKTKAESAPVKKETTTMVEKTSHSVPEKKLETQSIENIITGLGHLQSKFGESANVLQQKLSTETLSLQELHEKVEQHIADLNLLHNIEVDEQSLSGLMEKYEITTKVQEEEFTIKKKEISEATNEKQTGWEKEQEEYNKTINEKEKELKKQRQRENQEYKYDLEQEQNQDADDFEQTQKGCIQELNEIEEQQQFVWQEKEETLAKQEKEAKELTDKAEGLEKALEKAIKKAEEEGIGIAKRQSKNQADLLQKDQEGKKRVFELKINSLEKSIEKQTNQIQEISKQLSIATKQAQDLAVKALEGGTNANSFEAMKEIALEQAKNTHKGK